jgi:hypothetical protein
MVAVADSMADWNDHRTGPPVAELIELVACGLWLVRGRRREGWKVRSTLAALLWS